MNDQWPEEAKRYIERLKAELQRVSTNARTWESRCISARNRCQREYEISQERKNVIDRLATELGKLKRKHKCTQS